MVNLRNVTIVGVSPVSFTAPDGRVVTGYNVFFNFPLDVAGSSGSGSGRMYVGTNAFNRMSLGLGDEVQVAYINKRYELVG